jgi:DNA-binding NarL/FixJ family response regulator
MVAVEHVPVLIVDDQAPFRRAAATVVRLTPGFDVIGEASSGEEAIEMVEKLHPALVLMDINMDGIGGIEATRRIHEAHPEIVVVLLSTYSVDDLPAEATTCGARTYIHKERFEPAVLQEVWAVPA